MKNNYILALLGLFIFIGIFGVNATTLYNFNYSNFTTTNTTLNGSNIQLSYQQTTFSNPTQSGTKIQQGYTTRERWCYEFSGYGLLSYISNVGVSQTGNNRYYNGAWNTAPGPDDIVTSLVCGTYNISNTGNIIQTNNYTLLSNYNLLYLNYNKTLNGQTITPYLNINGIDYNLTNNYLSGNFLSGTNIKIKYYFIGNNSTTPILNNNISLEAFNLQINSPINGTYYNNLINILNVTNSLNTNLSYNLNNNTNITLGTNIDNIYINITGIEGQNNLTVFSNYNGIITNSSIIYFIDTILPIINIVSNGQEFVYAYNNNTYTKTYTTLFNITETNSYSCTKNYTNQNTGISVQNNCSIDFNFTSIGNYTLYINITDVASNTANSTSSFIVDKYKQFWFTSSFTPSLFLDEFYVYVNGTIYYVSSNLSFKSLNEIELPILTTSLFGYEDYNNTINNTYSLTNSAMFNQTLQLVPYSLTITTTKNSTWEIIWTDFINNNVTYNSTEINTTFEIEMVTIPEGYTSVYFYPNIINGTTYKDDSANVIQFYNDGITPLTLSLYSMNITNMRYYDAIITDISNSPIQTDAYITIYESETKLIVHRILWKNTDKVVLNLETDKTYFIVIAADGYETLEKTIQSNDANIQELRWQLTPSETTVETYDFIEIYRSTGTGFAQVGDNIHISIAPTNTIYNTVGVNIYIRNNTLSPYVINSINNNTFTYIADYALVSPYTKIVPTLNGIELELKEQEYKIQTDNSNCANINMPDGNQLNASCYAAQGVTASDANKSDIYFIIFMIILILAAVVSQYVSELFVPAIGILTIIFISAYGLDLQMIWIPVFLIVIYVAAKATKFRG